MFVKKVLSATAVALLAAPLALAAPDADRVTFTKDVLPILQDNCQDCHRPNGADLGGMVAPMAFTSYKETRPWAKAIAKVVESKEMPPWDAHPSFEGVFRNERTLAQDDIDTLVAWVEQGAARGREEDAPAPRVFPAANGWQIGEPDLIVRMPEPYFVSDDVEDLYVDFETELTEEMLSSDRYIKAIEFKPGSPVVHHIISNPLGGIAPGNDPTVYEDGFYQVLRKGTSVSFEMHYHKEPGPGTGQWDQSYVGIKFQDEDFVPKHQVRMAPLGKFDFRVPAGDPAYQASTSQSFDQEIMVLGMTPHMHLRGKAADYIAKLPDGSTEALLQVPAYDFNWQTNYQFAEPKILPAGSTVDLTMTWDNSTENPYNPDPTKTVGFGEPTTDEMMFGFMTYSLTDEPAVIELSEETVNTYAGTYAVAGTRFNVVARGTTVAVALGDQGPFGLEPRSETEFSLEMADMVFEFIRNADGEVNAIKVQGQGMNLTAKRVEEESASSTD